MFLPQDTVKEVNINPSKLIIFSHPKAGKTQAVSGLENNLILDFEDGSGYVTGFKINILKEAANKLGLNKPKEIVNHEKGYETILEIMVQISKELAEKKVTYDYITLDTATALIDIATYLATLRYKASPIGKNFTGKNVVKDLPNGAGYEHLREAFKFLLNMFEPYAKKCSIIIGHVRDASVIKAGVDLSAKDIMLPGKLKSIVCQDADAVGHLFRKDGYQTILSFKTDERDLATGARPLHLANKEFVLVEESPKNSRQFIYNWNQIFI